MMSQKNLQTFLIALVFTGFSFSVQAQSFKVTEQKIDDHKAVLATVETVDLTPARARIGGTISQLMIDEGVRVEQGSVIATIVDEKLNLELQAVEERTASLRAEKKLAKIALNRAQQLRKTGVGSQARLDEARTNLDVVNRNLKAMESDRELIRQREREGAVLSPASGTVTSVGVTQGVVIMPGEPIAHIAKEIFILRLEVPERHARFMKVGDPVIFTDQFDTKGTVQLVYPEMRKGRVVADVEMPDLEGRFIGERVRVLVKTGTRKTIMVPEKYLIKRFGLNFVTHKSGLESIVQIGSAHDEQVEILSGLKNGDELVMPALGSGS